MPDGTTSEHDLLDRAARLLAQTGLPVQPSGGPRALLAHYYRHVPPEDLQGRDAAAVAGAVAAHLRLAAARAPGAAAVRVSTPTVATDGWSAGRTVVQVVNDDMPFLVDSVTAELSRLGRGIRLVVHPAVAVRRDDAGALLAVGREGDPVESWMHLEVDRLIGPGELEDVAAGLCRVLADVRAVAEDWPEMTALAHRTADELEPAGGDAAEAADLLRWLAGRATLLGYDEHLYGTGTVPGTGRGLLRPELHSKARPLPPRPPSPDRPAGVLALRKGTARSTVRVRSYLDVVSVRRFDADGRPVGERRFLGLLSPAAQRESVLQVPVLRRKVQEVLDRSGFTPLSHSGRDLLQILETYPPDELFQATVDDLERVATAVLHLQERRQLRLFLRRDRDGGFMSCLIYLPRDLYTRAVRLRLEEVLREAFAASSVDYTARVTESVLARLHVVVRVPPGDSVRDVDVPALERRLAEVARSWDDDFAEAVLARLGEQEGTRLLRLHPDLFPEAYKQDVSPATAVSDLLRVDTLGREGGLALHLYRPAGGPADALRFKVLSDRPVSLSAVLPVLQHMSVEVLDSRPYRLHAGAPAWIYDFGLRAAGELQWPGTGMGTLFQDAFAAVWTGQAEDDGYNALVLRGGLSWRQAAVLRAYGKYLRQGGWTYSQDYVEQCLVAHGQVARLLLELFEAQFEPDDALSRPERDAHSAEVAARAAAAVERVQNLDQDRILRSFLAAVRATVRTNAYQRKPYLSLKLDPARVLELPQPRPEREVWVCSPQVEGVHLRFGAVARGGLRWSDRREDLRTEVLGLVKAQGVKNAVIVPVGAKGGFVAKQLPDASDREAWLAEGIASYRTFISGLLDLTDDLQDGQVVAPPRVVRHDGDDTYLVVAADKGTATFSDIANGLAAEYGFWLGDAFASGGSAGYDHKAMGITARGAWESVQRHFRELGVDTQTQEVTVVGIGDMSGDVFGNGMLLSRSLRLVAAFDHRHVFLDPDPDPETSYAERARLFALPRSSWADYDSALLSPGGGVYPRTAKSVPVSPQVRARLGLPDTVAALPPMQLLTAVLLAPVDLLWNGAIGTYVKSAAESHGDVGDKANDAVRVDGAQLRCRVVGEGGNLGFTQLGRIEAARAGVKLNTDAIDNSAGVDCSDHEVNIKILLDRVVRDGALTPQGRDALLAEMTDDVARLVLRDNYAQNVLLGNARASAPALVGVHRRYLRELEVAGVLNREIEFLPSGRELEARASAGTGLTSPELSVLAAYAKNSLKPQVLESSIPDEPWFQGELRRYFPPQLTERYGDRLADHPLRRQIVTTGIVNDLVNRAGITFAFRARDETGAGTDEIVRAYVLAREVFGLGDYWNAIEQLDGQVGTDVQVTLHVEGRRLVDRVTRWFLRARRASLDVDAELARFGPVVAGLLPSVPRLVQSDERAFLRGVEQALLDRGVPGPLAERSAALLHSFPLLHVVELAAALERPPAEVAELHFALAAEFGVDAWLGRVSALPRADRWQSLARSALREDLYAGVAGLTSDVLTTTEPGPPAQRLAAWREHHGPALVQAGALLTEVARGEACDLAALSVAVRAFRTVLRA